MLAERINKWVSNFSKSFFIFKDGFFEMPYLVNSPEAMLEAVSKQRLVKHSTVEKTIKAKNPFLQGITHYQKIEDGLWLMHGDYEYKKNVSFRRVDDKKSPSDYYSIRLNITSTKGTGKYSVVNGMPYSHNTWLVFKPNAKMTIFHFKGSKEVSLTVFFSRQWLKKVLSETPEYKNSSIIYFFEKEANHIIWPDKLESVMPVYQPLSEYFHARGNQENSESQKESLKNLTMDFINLFINKYNRDEISKYFYEIPDSERLKILKAEHILIDNIHAPFIGIEALAAKVGISQTQLKSHFKMIFGEPVFQYFRRKQMEYAYSLLQNKNTSIKEIAGKLGYENASKFTAAFKQQHNILPSEV
jgi:AraC-like DNA-binding protein